MLARSSGWNSAESAESRVSGRLPTSKRPSCVPASIIPGQTSSPLASITLAPSGIAVLESPIAGDLAAGDHDDRPSAMSGPETGWTLAPVMA